MTPLPHAALATAALLSLPAAAHAASSTVTAPADGTTYVYDNDGHPGVVASVDGTATGAAQVDLRCAERSAGTWYFSSVLSGGAGLNASGGSFHAANVTLPAQQLGCQLVALPTGQPLPTSPAGYAGPRLRLLAALLQGAGLQDANGGANQGKRYDFVAFATGTGADALWSSAASGGVEETNLLAPSPEETGQVFSSSDVIVPTDPTTGPDPDATSTGIVVDGVNAFLGPTWEDAVTPAMQFVLGSLTPFPTVTAAPSQAADGSLVTDEHDVVVHCTGNDPNYFSPAGFTCPPLGSAGVALDLQTTMAPGGTVITRRWRFSSTDGQPHAVRLVLAHRASLTTPGRVWRFPGQDAYAAHVAGDVVTPPAAGPWTVRFRTQDAADGDPTTGVGAVTSSLAPSALRFILARGFTATYAIAVPAAGSADLRDVLMGEATQDALERDIAAAEGKTTTTDPGSGGTPAGSGGAAPGAGSPAGPAPAPAPAARRPALPAAAAVIRLPSAKACVSRRRLTLHLRPPAGLRIAKLTVKVGKRTTHPKVRGTAPIVLAGLPKGRYTVAVTVRFADGRTLTLRRAYRTCAPKRRR